jgi:DnaK suppressor protein
MEQEKLEGIRRDLEAELSSVQHQLAEYGVSPEGEGMRVSVNEGFADSAQATAERSQMLSIVEQLQEHHGEVEAALRRIEEGTYGKCERCGETIPVERLEALPTARLCVSCKQASGKG